MKKMILKVLSCLVALAFAFLIGLRTGGNLSRGLKSDLQLADAAGRGDLTMIKSLLQQGASINYTDPVKFGWSPLINAIFHHETKVIRYLVEAGADVNLSDKNGTTPLMWMVSHGDDGLETVKYLITQGARLEAKDKNGHTVFDYAAADPPRPKIRQALEEAKNSQELKKKSEKQ